MKTFNNTALICVTMGLLTGSVLAALMIHPGWLAPSVIFGPAFGMFAVMNEEKDVSPRTKNTFKKK